MTCEALVDVLKEVRALLTRPETQVAWSRWKSPDEAIAEIDDYLRRIEEGGTIKLIDLQVLFGPTGSLQEVSINSGWGDYFLRLAGRFDLAIADL